MHQTASLIWEPSRTLQSRHSRIIQKLYACCQ